MRSGWVPWYSCRIPAWAWVSCSPCAVPTWNTNLPQPLPAPALLWSTERLPKTQCFLAHSSFILEGEVGHPQFCWAINPTPEWHQGRCSLREWDQSKESSSPAEIQQVARGWCCSFLCYGKLLTLVGPSIKTDEATEELRKPKETPCSHELPFFKYSVRALGWGFFDSVQNKWEKLPVRFLPLLSWRIFQKRWRSRRKSSESSERLHERNMGYPVVRYVPGTEQAPEHWVWKLI